MFTFIGPFRFHTFTLAVSLACLLSLGLLLWRVRGRLPYRAAADAYLGALVLGFVLARAEYILLNRAVFGGDVGRMLDMGTGGLDWHGALLGGWLGLTIVARLRRVDRPALLFDGLTPALPLVAFAAWTGCRAVGCAYGLEVETLALHPWWQVAEARDIFGMVAPRYNTHGFGQALAWGLGVLVAVFWLRNTWAAAPARRFWLVWVLFCGGMLALGTVRGDYAPRWAGIRADRWLDSGLLLVGVAGLLRTRAAAPRPAE